MLLEMRTRDLKIMWSGYVSGNGFAINEHSVKIYAHDSKVTQCLFQSATKVFINHIYSALVWDHTV